MQISKSMKTGTLATINKLNKDGVMEKLVKMYYEAGTIIVIDHMKQLGYDKEVIQYILICCHAQYNDSELIAVLKAEKGD